MLSFYTIRRENLKTQQSSVILDLCLKKTWTEKSRDYHDVVIFEKLRFQNHVFPSFLALVLPHFFSRSPFFCSFPTTESLEQAKLSSTLKRKAGLKNVFEKLRFHDGLVLTAGLNAGIKLRCKISPAWCGPNLRLFSSLPP